MLLRGVSKGRRLHDYYSNPDKAVTGITETLKQDRKESDYKFFLIRIPDVVKASSDALEDGDMYWSMHILDQIQFEIATHLRRLGFDDTRYTGEVDDVRSVS